MIVRIAECTRLHVLLGGYQGSEAVGHQLATAWAASCSTGRSVSHEI